MFSASTGFKNPIRDFLGYFMGGGGGVELDEVKYLYDSISDTDWICSPNTYNNGNYMQTVSKLNM